MGYRPMRTLLMNFEIADSTSKSVFKKSDHMGSLVSRNQYFDYNIRIKLSKLSTINLYNH